MITASVELEHNGKNWVLVVIPAESAERIDIPVIDAQAQELKDAGVDTYDAG